MPEGDVGDGLDPVDEPVDEGLAAGVALVAAGLGPEGDDAHLHPGPVRLNRRTVVTTLQVRQRQHTLFFTSAANDPSVSQSVFTNTEKAPQRNYHKGRAALRHCANLSLTFALVTQFHGPSP